MRGSLLNTHWNASLGSFAPIMPPAGQSKMFSVPNNQPGPCPLPTNKLQHHWGELLRVTPSKARFYDMDLKGLFTQKGISMQTGTVKFYPIRPTPNTKRGSNVWPCGMFQRRNGSAFNHPSPSAPHKFSLNDRNDSKMNYVNHKFINGTTK